VREAVGTLVTLNNFVHDLAAAVWFCGTVLAYIAVREGMRQGAPETGAFASGIALKMCRVANVVLGVVIAGGIVRALAYTRYEWAEAAGRGQVRLLLLKHVLLFCIVALGAYLQVRLRRDIRRGLR
jgi:putative copper export protein